MPMFDFSNKMSEVHHRMTKIQFLMQLKVKMEKMRWTILKEYFNAYFIDLKSRMQVSKRKVDKEMF